MVKGYLVRDVAFYGAFLWLTAAKTTALRLEQHATATEETVCKAAFAVQAEALRFVAGVHSTILVTATYTVKVPAVTAEVGLTM